MLVAIVGVDDNVFYSGLLVATRTSLTSNIKFMKKKQSEVAAKYYLLQKLLRGMKVTVFLLLAFFLQVNAKSYSQQARVSLNCENVALLKVMKSLEKQTSLYFFFNDKMLDTEQKVSISVENENLENVLQKLFAADYEWEVVDNMIVLKRREVEQQQQQTKKMIKVSGIVKDDKGGVLPGVTVLINKMMTAS